MLHWGLFKCGRLFVQLCVMRAEVSSWWMRVRYWCKETVWSARCICICTASWIRVKRKGKVLSIISADSIRCQDFFCSVRVEKEHILLRALALCKFWTGVKWKIWSFVATVWAFVSRIIYAWWFTREMTEYKGMMEELSSLHWFL